MKNHEYDKDLRPDEVERLAEINEAQRDLIREKRQIRQRLRARVRRKQQRTPDNGLTTRQ